MTFWPEILAGNSDSKVENPARGVNESAVESVKKTLLEKENTVLFFSLQDPDQNQILMERRRRGAVRMHRTCVCEAD